MKKQLLAGLIATAIASPAFACTTILVGNQVSSDGSFLVARNEDYSATNAKHFLIHPRKENQRGEFHSNGNDFTYPLPEISLRYTSLSDYDTQDRSMGEAGFNELGVGMTATETIYNGQQVLKYDPYVLKTGINEDSIENVILPRIHSAKEGAELLGKIIETKGAAEGFGVAFVDKHDIWYLETGSGHQWMARRIPHDKYFVSANQGRLQKVDLKDSHNYLGSKDLISFAIKHGLYNPKTDGAFNFHTVYSQDLKNDVTYNYPRVWTLQHKFNPGLATKIGDGKSFPVFLKPAHKLSVQDLESALRNHYQGTPHDPYMNANPNEPYRPISVFRTQESHILQVRPDMPAEIGNVEYVAFGMTALGVYLPFYQGITQIPKGFDVGTNKASNDSVAWKFRKLQTLAMVNYKQYAPIVQKAYHQFEKQTFANQKKMEQRYLAIYKKDPKAARELIQNLENKTTEQALVLTDQLTNQLFTKLTHDTDMKYHFEGA
ncbi:C69 family dipeptidase [Dongshaea marina]|uniref:C69 family dipeptidase n=1 Tax=Dongshaea marina TaxID=2047966 RepID=UPI000D3E4F8E|nr:C69 family dipeptidase [Dongshaea marina]